ncbi:MAG: hypothetical protein IKE52_05975 [Mogibacterium sp.]|nr:hypothetical protein [Mogibacterium sp.]
MIDPINECCSTFEFEFIDEEDFSLTFGEAVELPDHGGGGTDDYDLLKNKPKFNGITVEGNKESQDYNLTLSVQEIEKILYLD